MKHLAALVAAVVSATAAIAAQAPPKPPQGQPSEFRVCMGGCNLYVWDGAQYDVKLPEGSTFKGTSVWKIESFTREKVIVHRTDTYPGGSFTAIYSGQIGPDGNHLVNGLSNGSPADFRMVWGAVLSEPPLTVAQMRVAAFGSPASPLAGPALPDEFRACMGGCNLYVRDGDHFKLKSAPDNFKGESIWVVDSFTPDSVEIRRKDIDPNKKVLYATTYKAQISADRSRLINITADGKPANVRFVWGPALSAPAMTNAQMADAGLLPPASAPQKGDLLDLLTDAVWKELPKNAERMEKLSRGTNPDLWEKDPDGPLHELYRASQEASHADCGQHTVSTVNAAGFRTTSTVKDCDGRNFSAVLAESDYNKALIAAIDRHDRIAALESQQAKLTAQCKANDKKACDDANAVAAQLKKYR